MSTHETLLGRSLRRLRRAWSELGSTLRGERHEIDPALGAEDAERLGQAIHDCLGSPGGDYARRAQAARIGQSYLSLNRTGRERFWRLLARDFDTDPAAVRGAIDDYLQAAPGTEEARRRHRLRAALVAPRAQLLTLFTTLPEGIKFLVDMRGELLGAGAAADPELHALEQDLKLLLASWFDIGFLQLRRVDWNTPAAFLEKLIEHEAVHAITSWADLKNRLASDRRLYSFVHPNMAEEPLIFLQVALCDELATNVQALLDTDAGTLDSGRADTAIFYSITNAQHGLSGISFGNYLIRRVVADLKRELPGLRQFATLSPVPGFAAWLRERPGLLAAPALAAPERQALERLTAERAVDGVAGLLAVPGWHRDEAVAQALRPALLGLCARYLCEKTPGKARALDAVAHFHLGNGATLQQIDWMADSSAKGLAQSFGIMVNYLYDPRTIDGNSESYALQGSIATSAAIRELLRERDR